MRLKKVLAISIAVAMLFSFVMVMPVSAANNRVDLSVDEVVFVQGMTSVTLEIRQSEEVPNIIGGHPLRIWLNGGTYSIETPPVPLTISAAAESGRLSSMGGNELGGAPNRTWWQSNATGGAVAEGTLLATLTIGSSAVITTEIDDYTLYIREWMGGAAATPTDAVEVPIRLLPYATVGALRPAERVVALPEGSTAAEFIAELATMQFVFDTDVPGVTFTLLGNNPALTWTISATDIDEIEAGSPESEGIVATATLAAGTTGLTGTGGAVINVAADVAVSVPLEIESVGGVVRVFREVTSPTPVLVVTTPGVAPTANVNITYRLRRTDTDGNLITGTEAEMYVPITPDGTDFDRASTLPLTFGPAPSWTVVTAGANPVSGTATVERTTDDDEWHAAGSTSVSILMVVVPASGISVTAPTNLLQVRQSGNNSTLRVVTSAPVAASDFSISPAANLNGRVEEIPNSGGHMWNIRLAGSGIALGAHTLTVTGMTPSGTANFTVVRQQNDWTPGQPILPPIVQPPLNGNDTPGRTVTANLPGLVGEVAHTASNQNRTVTVNISAANLEDMNTTRIVAINADGDVLGGSFNSATGVFTLTSETEIGNFTVTYVEALRRLSLAIGSHSIMDAIENTVAVAMDVPAIIVDDRTVLPVRFVAYALGGEVIPWSYYDDEQVVTITLGDQTVSLTIGQANPGIGMDVPAQIINDRTYVPLRFVSEFFGANVTWNDPTRTVEIVL